MHREKWIPFPVLWIFLWMIPLVSSRSSTITFSAKNSQTGQSVTLAGVYAENLTLGTDTVLVNASSFDLGGGSGVTRTDSEEGTSLAVSEAYPSVCTGETKFQVSLPENVDVHVTAYNILGQRITDYSAPLEHGRHDFGFRAGSLASGVYILRVQAGQAARSIKILKTRRDSGETSTIVHRGFSPFPKNPGKPSFNPGDRHRFTGYAFGFEADTLDNQTPQGGETLLFTLTPNTSQPVLPRLWKGFNLLGKFTKEWSNEGYLEDDFAMIAELGFNFVRLPVDYRTYTVQGNWTRFVERELEDIDDAVQWGGDYGIHVCLNLHRAPGYCVNPPSTPLPASESASLWTSPEAQRVFAYHWGMLARRYKHVPDSVLSFNLVNEPGGITGNAYVKAVKDAIAAIRAVSPNRLIIADALGWPYRPVEEMIPYQVVQSPHFYDPMQVTHYKADWVSGSDTWPVPVWPILRMSSYLYGPSKSPWNTPLKLQGNFLKGTEISILVHQVSYQIDLVTKADGVKIWDHQFRPGPGAGKWSEVVYASEWNIYQNIYDRTYAFTLSADASEISFQATAGDWMTFNELLIKPPASSGRPQVVLQPGISDWGVPQTAFALSDDGTLTILAVPKGFESAYKEDAFLDEWKAFMARGVSVHGGEWGVYNETPHDVTLDFMEDRLKAFDDAGIGWALWNFRGSFGILDSGRQDVEYEDFYGYPLDREMLDLLQAEW